MKKLAALVATLFSLSAHAATAYWTGRSEYVTTITGRMGISCEYSYFGRTFWRTFVQSACPTSVQVQ